MKFITLLCLLLFALRDVHAQTDRSLHPINAQNAAQLELLTRLGRGTVNALAWSPDGTTLAVASAAGVWLLDDALVLIAQPAVHEPAISLAWRPDGQEIAVVLKSELSCQVQVWDAGVTEQRFSADVCGDSVQWSADNIHIALFDPGFDSGDLTFTATRNTVYLINTISGDLHALPGQSGAWAPSGQVLFTRLLPGPDYFGEPLVYSWDAATGDQRSILEIKEGDGFPILWGQDDDTLVLRCGETVDEGVILRLCAFNVRNGSYQALNWIAAFSIDGTCVCVFGLEANDAHTLFAYVGRTSYNDGYLSPILVVDDAESEPEFVGYGTHYTWKPDSRQLTAAVGNGWLRTYDADTGEIIAESQLFTPPINMIAIKHETTEIVSAAFGYDQPTSLWDFRRDEFDPVRTFMLEMSQFARFTPDGSMLVAGGMVVGETAVNQRVVGLNADTGERIQDIASFYAQGDIPPERFWNADYSAFAEILDGEAVLLPNGNIIEAETGTILESIAWSPDSSMIATVERVADDYSFYVRTWQVSDGSLINRYASGMFAFRGLVWSPTGQQVAVMLEHPTGSGIHVRGLRVFSVRPAQNYLFDQNDFEVFRVVNVRLIDQQAMAVWNSDGTLLAVVVPEDISYLQVYPLDQTEPLVSLPTAAITDLEWSSDDQFIAAGSENGTIWIWGVPFSE